MVDLRPQPVTLADEFMAAVHDRLAEQNDLLRQLLDRTPPVEKPDDGGGAVLVTEPAPPPRAVAKKAAPVLAAKKSTPPAKGKT